MNHHYVSFKSTNNIISDLEDSFGLDHPWLNNKDN